MGVHEKPIYQYRRGDCLKGRGIGQVADLSGGGGGLARKRGVVFLRERVDTPLRTVRLGTNIRTSGSITIFKILQ